MASCLEIASRRSHSGRRGRGPISTLAVLGVLAIGAVLPHAAWAQGGTWQYTYPPNGPCTSIPDVIDPINIVFVGAPDWETVDSHFDHHLLWGSTDSGSLQSAQDATGACAGVARQRATADSSSSDRLHARMFEYGYGYESGGGDGWHIHVSAHHDLTVQDASGDDCHAVPPDGFNSTRDSVLNSFTDGYPFFGAHVFIKWADWGNTKPIEQCNGEPSASDGHVAFISAQGSDWWDP